MEKELILRFVRGFQKAVRAEMEAMRASQGDFEIPLTMGRRVDADGGETTGRRFSYEFDLSAPSDKLLVDAECTLRCNRSDSLVVLEQVDQKSVRLSSAEEIDLDADSHILVIYPWFLYEKLLQSLEELTRNADAYFVHSALTLFGKRPPTSDEERLSLSHPELNDSQRKAVELCCRSSLAFVWGPPGTGKTRTLGHVVSELLHKGHRVLVTSTTNAAVDQALAQLKELNTVDEDFDAGRIIRLGQSSAPTFGTSLREVAGRLNAERQQKLHSLEERRLEIDHQIESCRSLLASLEASRADAQLTLFADERPNPALRLALRRLFSPLFTARLNALPAQDKISLVTRRRLRLERLEALYISRIGEERKILRQQEVFVVQQARLVLATMTNVYLSKLLHPERFDVVIVEEAGMAILPTLFYCASLARQKVIAVGDPRQLPPIVQSRAPYVYRAMGRDIFSVAVPQPLASDLVVLLDTQYRMHPIIGNLVSDLFYEGKLLHGTTINERRELSRHLPFPDQPLVVIDTTGQTSCTTRGGFSRCNELSAQCCVKLARIARRDGLHSIGIITPYVEQAKLIRRLLSATGGQGHQDDIECSTVHRFQGHQRDIIILDTVDAHPLPPGVLLNRTGTGSSAANLLNVSVSRARGKLLLIADVAYFRQQAPTGPITRLLACATSLGTLHPMESEQS